MRKGDMRLDSSETWSQTWVSRATSEKQATRVEFQIKRNPVFMLDLPHAGTVDYMLFMYCAPSRGVKVKR